MTFDDAEDAGAGAIVYPSADDVIDLHAQLFAISLEQAGARLRNRPGLEGAVVRPRQHALYGGADFAHQAAVLAHGIAEGQPFIDGNKRTTFVALSVFLEVNDFRLGLAEDELALLILDLSSGLTVEGLAERIRANLLTADGG